jgi:carbamoyltransferase
MRILGISCYFHDAAAALLEEGILIAAAEEERFSRIKHDYAFPQRAIRFCLDRGRITGADLDYVAFFEKPFVKFDRIVRSAIATAPRSHAVFRKAMTTWMLDKLWVKGRIRDTVGLPDDRILFVEHHQSHAASAFFCSPFSEAAVLTVDGVGEWATATTGFGTGTQLTIDREIRFPHSLGLLYSAFTAFLGFEVNEGEYKVMGMAPYGVPRYQDKVWKLIDVASDGAFALNLDYFSFHHSSTRTYSRKFEELFGPPRSPETPFFTAASGYPSYFGPEPANYRELAAVNQHYADVAASIQAVIEEVLLRMVRTLVARTGATGLCMAGGVALNSVANGRILRETPITDLYVQPAAGDSGAALGAALFVQHQVLGQPRRFVMEHAYWGAVPNGDEVRQTAGASGVRHVECKDDNETIARTVQLLIEGKVIGWAQGAFEWGPRALGNRSILADPRRVDMKDIVNTKIKFREPYRPFAPSVLVERAADLFGLAEPERQWPARFMLLVVPVLDAARDKIPAVTHVDGSARLQTVAAATNPRYHALIRTFGDATGIPAVLNTSFNLRGEPIVNTPAEALSTFVRSEMDALVLDRTILYKDS